MLSWKLKLNHRNPIKITKSYDFLLRIDAHARSSAILPDPLDMAVVILSWSCRDPVVVLFLLSWSCRDPVVILSWSCRGASFVLGSHPCQPNLRSFASFHWCLVKTLKTHNKSMELIYFQWKIMKSSLFNGNYNFSIKILICSLISLFSLSFSTFSPKCDPQCLMIVKPLPVPFLCPSMRFPLCGFPYLFLDNKLPCT